jgi:hypothetical protein
MKWEAKQYTIHSLLKLDEEHRLELRPDFQRRSVWSEAAKIMLIDTILRDIPMPKIYVHMQKNRKNKDLVAVIDGQQRIRAILEFVQNSFNLKAPYNGDYKGAYFRDLQPELLEKYFFSYKIDVNEIYTDSAKLVREIYSRVNKYTVALNRQELRRADFPGDFLKLSETLSLHEFFEDAKIFTITSRRRMNDVEYISELLAALLDGPQDKKDSLDFFYEKYRKWNKEEKTKIQEQFQDIFCDLSIIFPTPKLNISLNKSRFKQKADFYSLFLAIHDLKSEGYSIKDKDISFLQEDLELLDDNIAPDSRVEKFSEYAIKCTSQANTIGSRTWRRDFLENVLRGTYKAEYPSQEVRKEFHLILWDLYSEGDNYCPPYMETCSLCNNDLENYKEENVTLTWPPSAKVYQLSNAIFVHNSCLEQKGLPDRFTLELPFGKED